MLKVSIKITNASKFVHCNQSKSKGSKWSKKIRRTDHYKETDIIRGDQWPRLFRTIKNLCQIKDLQNISRLFKKMKKKKEREKKEDYINCGSKTRELYHI